MQLKSWAGGLRSLFRLIQDISFTNWSDKSGGQWFTDPLHWFTDACVSYIGIEFIFIDYLREYDFLIFP